MFKICRPRENAGSMLGVVLCHIKMDSHLRGERQCFFVMHREFAGTTRIYATTLVQRVTDSVL
jgi:hypothetical protein